MKLPITGILTTFEDATMMERKGNISDETISIQSNFEKILGKDLWGSETIIFFFPSTE